MKVIFKSAGGGSYVLGLIKGIFVCLECCAYVGCLWYWVTSSRLWSNRMVSGLRSSMSSHHCCMVPCGVFHSHEYSLLMAFAPHLSFQVVLLMLVMLCDFVLRVGLRGVG